MKAPLELLAAAERSLRPPLPDLLDRIDRRLDDLPAPSPFSDEDVFSLVQCYNLCAFVEAFMGRAEEARRVCLDEIGWLARIASDTGRTGVLSYAFQPWVNLARLDRIAGDLVGARKRLDVLRAAWQGRPVALCDVVLRPQDLPALVEHVPGLPSFLRFNWIHERLLCELRRGSPDGIEEIEAVAYAQRSILFNGMFLEACLIARRQAGDDRGAELACPYPDVVEGFPVNVVLAIRGAELALSGSPDAEDAINTLALSKIGVQLLSGAPSPWHLAVVQPVVHLLGNLRPSAAFALASSAYEAAERLSDEVLQAWFAAACAAQDSADPVWEARRQELAARSWHASIGRCESCAASSRVTRVDDVRTRLVERSDTMISSALAARADAVVPSLDALDAAVPRLLGGIRPADGDARSATATLQFGSRRLHRLAPLVSAATPTPVRAMIDACEFASQPSLSGKGYREALAVSGPVARYVLERTADLLHRVFGADFDEDRIRVCVRMDEKSRYRQIQGPHVDWTKGTVLDERMLEEGLRDAQPAEGFAALASCYSVDCVVGNPPTDYFLDECTGLCRLTANDSGTWIIDSIEFDVQGAPEPAPAACFLLRLPYTIHQFPGVEQWTAGNKLRLFVSCDYHLA